MRKIVADKDDHGRIVFQDELIWNFKHDLQYLKQYA